MALWHERNFDTVEMELQFGADHLKIAVDVSSFMSNSEVNNIQTSAALLYNVIITRSSADADNRLDALSV